MPENPKILRRRIKSINSTRKITRTMEMIAAAKLRRVQNAMESARPYADKVEALVGRLAQSEAAADQPLFDQREGGRLTVVVIASDRGLCGGYNMSVLREAEKYIEANGGNEAVEVFAVGKRSRDYFAKNSYNVIDSRADLGGNVEVEMAQEIASLMVERFLTGQTDRVVLIFNGYVSAVAYTPTVTQFLPLAPTDLEDDDGEASEETSDNTFQREIDYLFEPSDKRVLAQLLPRYIQTKVFAAMLEAMTTEHNARRIAMNNATENCGELIDTLTLKANKARQAAITNEILEIVGGAEALKG